MPWPVHWEDNDDLSEQGGNRPQIMRSYLYQKIQGHHLYINICPPSSTTFLLRSIYFSSCLPIASPSPGSIAVAKRSTRVIYTEIASSRAQNAVYQLFSFCCSASAWNKSLTGSIDCPLWWHHESCFLFHWHVSHKNASRRPERQCKEMQTSWSHPVNSLSRGSPAWTKSRSLEGC